jgi:seryl-tRNA synthetase
MIDIELLRNNPDIFRNSQKRRNQDAGVIDAFLATDKLWREKTSESENMRALQKKLGAERKIEEAKALKEKLVVLQNELADLDAKRNAIALSIPNLLADDVPEGKDDEEKNKKKREEQNEVRGNNGNDDDTNEIVE